MVRQAAKQDHESNQWQDKRSKLSAENFQSFSCFIKMKPSNSFNSYWSVSKSFVRTEHYNDARMLNDRVSRYLMSPLIIMYFIKINEYRLAHYL